MLIPIDNDVDVQHINEKEASIALQENITNSCNSDFREKMQEALEKRAFAIASNVEDAQHQANIFIQAYNRSQRALVSNNYTYLTADVCDMITETQQSLPSWTVSDLPIQPGVSGIILFEKPKYQTSMADFQNSQIVPLSTDVLGLLWTYYTDTYIEDIHGTPHTDALWVGLITDYSQNSKKSTRYGYASGEFAYAIDPDESLTPICIHNDQGPYDEAIVDYFAATMMLIQQREIIAEPETYKPTVKRGKRRDPVLIPTGKNGEKIPFRISTVSLSETARTAYAANNAGTGHKPNKSWWVKGHWRRQPYGPQSSLRKLIYIHPHISGNVNAPLDERKTITKVVP